ncbi:MAG: AAA family ATPase [Clostridia bacterium]|nr:AAA family ATPase [Clostridia bacterium]
MQYLDSFTLPTRLEEDNFILNYPPQLEMQCYAHNNVYPFKLFPQKQLTRLDFTPLTVLAGSNGSGKSTLLNLIAEKLKLRRSSPWNSTPFVEPYLTLCRARFADERPLPDGSRIITSDDVFDYMLDLRALNEGVTGRRESLFDEYENYTDARRPSFQLRSLDDYDELKRRNEARHSTKSACVTRRMRQTELKSGSNGENAYFYFTQQITQNALYLLDEPENSLAPARQLELAQFIVDSVRFYGCQFVISTHSPFLLAMQGAKVYDLDSVPVAVRKWTELEHVRMYHDFFAAHSGEFA